MRRKGPILTAAASAASCTWAHAPVDRVLGQGRVSTCRSVTDSGWREAWGRWELLHSGRLVAVIYVDRDGRARMTLHGQKIWRVKHVTAGGLNSGKRFAERWCAARWLLDVPSRVGAAQLRGNGECG